MTVNVRVVALNFDSHSGGVMAELCGSDLRRSLVETLLPILFDLFGSFGAFVTTSPTHRGCAVWPLMRTMCNLLV